MASLNNHRAASICGALATSAVVVILATLLLGACATVPTTEDAAAQAGPEAEPVEIELAEPWSNAEVRINAVGDHGVEGDRIRAGFTCEWTDGQEAGPVYPQQFVRSDDGEEVPMDFTWDNGGLISQGLYDVYIEIDSRAGDGWIRNLPLTGDEELVVTIDLNACRFDLPLDRYREVTVYPSGTYSDYESRNMLDSIPEEAAVSWYNAENRGQWAVAPSGTFDLKLVYTDDSVEWLQDYELPRNARVSEL